MELTRKQPDPQFWQGKRVLITGHTGFKGGWLGLWLKGLGAETCGLALPPSTEPAMFKVANVADGLHHRVADIRDHAAVQQVFEYFRPEIVFHMAAQPLVRLSYRNPVDTYATNVMGTVHVLEAARTCGSVRTIVNVTTDKCYENREWIWAYREDEPMGGHDPYSSSKGCAELVSAAYRKSFLDEAGISMATARAGNVIGGGDWALDRIVPDTLQALEKGQPVLVRSPHAIRPWQHVLEPLSGYLLLAEALQSSGRPVAQAWNFGPRDDDAWPVARLVQRLCDGWGEGASWLLSAGDHPHEANFLKLDSSKARQVLGWSPRWPVDVALAKVLEWHRAWLRGADMRKTSLEQIESYCGG